MPLLSHDGFGLVQDDAELSHRKEFGPNRVKANDKNGTDHLIELVGWGVEEESGTPYWEMRNSWGDYWGDGGFARVRRGRNDLLIESDCTWVNPSGWGSGAPGNENVPVATRWQEWDGDSVDAASAVLLDTVSVAHTLTLTLTLTPDP